MRENIKHLQMHIRMQIKKQQKAKGWDQQGEKDVADIIYKFVRSFFT